MRLFFVFFVTLALGGFFIATYLYKNPEGYIHPLLIPPDYFWLDNKTDIYQETGVLHIAGRSFRIPVVYVDGRFVNGHKYDSIVMQYMLPKYKSYYIFDDLERRRLLSKGLTGGMFLEAASARPGLDKQVHNMRRSLTKAEVLESNIYSLRQEKWYRGDTDELELRYDVFLNVDDTNRIVDFIDCDPLGKAKIPSCSHKFIDKGIVYRIRYNRSRFLKEWAIQRQTAVNFVESFEIKNSE